MPQSENLPSILWLEIINHHQIEISILIVKESVEKKVFLIL